MQTTSAHLLVCSWFQRGFLKTDGTAVLDVPFPLGGVLRPMVLHPNLPASARTEETTRPAQWRQWLPATSAPFL